MVILCLTDSPCPQPMLRRRDPDSRFILWCWLRKPENLLGNGENREQIEENRRKYGSGASIYKITVQQE